MRAQARILDYDNPAIDDDCEPLPPPRPSDWLAVHPEAPQSYAEFVRSAPNRPDELRNVIYLQPFDAVDPCEAPSLDELGEFASAFFGLPVIVLEPQTISGCAITRRDNPRSGGEQLLAGDLLEILRDELPSDAFCLLGISLTDLYPDDSWDFVFGQASLRERIGVMSFARYDPRFYGEPWDESARRRMFVRSAKVLAHEVGHMFGIRHCVLHRCLMNGSNHLTESDARPLHLCPEDTRKLAWSLRFDPRVRYRRLAALWRRHGQIAEAHWLERRAPVTMAVR